MTDATDSLVNTAGTLLVLGAVSNMIGNSNRNNRTRRYDTDRPLRRKKSRRKTSRRSYF